MPRPVSVMCYICGREFGSKSINIHIPQCEKKWENEQNQLPKKQRRPPPTKPFGFDQAINGGLKGKDLDAAMEEYNAQALDDFNKKSLLECKNCGRTFLPKPLEIHSRSCKPGQEKKRQPKSPTKVGLPQPNIKKSSLPLPKGVGNKAVVGSASPSPEPLGTSNTISSSGRSSLSPERNNNNNSNDKYQIRPGTYKKSETTPCSDFMDENPTREDIISMVEKDVAFSSLDNRRLLMAFIKKICQAS